MNYNHLSLLDLIKLSTRVFFVKPTRTYLTILGTSVGISAVVFLVSLGYGFQYLLLGKLVTTQDSLITLSASYPSETGLLIYPKTINDVSQLEGVSEISRMGEFSGEMDYEKLTGLLLIKEIEPSYFRLSGVSPDVGTTPSDKQPGVVLTSQALRLIGLPADTSSLGKEISLKAYYQDQHEETAQEADSVSALPIVGLVTDDTEPPAVYAYSSAFSIQPPFFKEIFVKSQNLKSVEPLREKLTDKGFLISAKVDLVNQANKILNAITIVLGVFGITALIVSAIGMFNTMIVGFLERIYEVGVMKSLGATDTDVRNLFLMESFLMGLSGGVTGVLLGMGAGKLVNFGLNVLASRLGGKPLQLFVTPWWFILLILGTSGLIGVMAGFWPAHRASVLSPKEAFLRK
jgi:ABC-type antimicrobial peptide transport system permease subunit